jgi:hypothetical protein
MRLLQDRQALSTVACIALHIFSKWYARVDQGFVKRIGRILEQLAWHNYEGGSLRALPILERILSCERDLGRANPSPSPLGDVWIGAMS